MKSEMMSAYVLAMKNIETPPLNIYDKKKRRMQPAYACMPKFMPHVACILVLALLAHSLYKPHISMTVYASDGSLQEISGRAIRLEMEDSLAFDMLATEENSDSVVYTTRFVVGCQNEGAEVISYEIVNEECCSNIYDLRKSKAWFAREEVLSKNEFDEAMNRDVSYPYVYAKWTTPGTGEYNGYRYMGPLYEQKVTEVKGSKCKLAVRLEKNTNEYHMDPLDICIKVQFEDGTIAEKAVKVYLENEGGYPCLYMK